MNLQNGADFEIALDVTLAAHTSLPVLITGAPASAIKLATTIARRDGNGYHGDLRIIDAANPADFLRLMMNADAIASDGCRTVVVRNIDTLREWQQDAMSDMIRARCRTRTPPSWRLITATSVPLIERVAAGRFTARLFYLLNAIHIVVS